MPSWASILILMLGMTLLCPSGYAQDSTAVTVEQKFLLSHALLAELDSLYILAWEHLSDVKSHNGLGNALTSKIDTLRLIDIERYNDPEKLSQHLSLLHYNLQNLNHVLKRPPSPNLNKLTGSKNVDTRHYGQGTLTTTRPIAEDAIVGIWNRALTPFLEQAKALSYISRQINETNGNIVQSAQAISKELRLLQYQHLYQNYLSLRAELTRVSLRRNINFALSFPGYSNNVMGVGILFSPASSRFMAGFHGLYDFERERFGTEVVAGVMVGDFAFLPGIIYIGADEDAVAFSGSVLYLRRPLTIGASFSTVQGPGFKVIIMP